MSCFLIVLKQLRALLIKLDRDNYINSSIAGYTRWKKSNIELSLSKCVQVEFVWPREEKPRK